MKNVVFIPNIDLGNGRNNSYHYSIDSWSKWCDLYDCELLVWEDLLFPIEQMKITWQRYYLFDILDANKIEYDQILMVDADTIVHPDCPNFFTETDRKYCGVMNDGDYEWVLRSIRGFGDILFEGKRIKPWNYINGGFQIVNETHKDFFSEMKGYYLENQDKIIETIKELRTATDQTILNFMLVEHNIDVKILPQCYNLSDLWRKNLLYVSKECWWEDDLINLYNSGWVYHFNAIPKNTELNRDANYWILRIYNELYSYRRPNEGSILLRNG
jgi:lipopolysaccharide biosynthesis glycosyltransferase